jgi:hypothetical protein
MTSRERVEKALNHRQPDRVPIDIGATRMTGIVATAYSRLREHVGLGVGPPRVYDLMQMLVEVEPDFLARFHIDVVGVEPVAPVWHIENRNWKPWQLPDGTAVQVPGVFEPTTDTEGNTILHDGGPASAPPVAIMPKGGYYFDAIGGTQASADFQPPTIAEYRRTLESWPDEHLQIISERARTLYEGTNYALVGGWYKGGLGGVGSFADWMILLATEKQYVSDLFDAQVEHGIRELERYRDAVGDRICAIAISGNDFGTQKGELFSPEWWVELYAPHYKRFNDWVHQHTRWKTFYHSCGSIYHLIEPMIQIGVDILNPVQCSAANMEPERLKREFGSRLCLWGGGVDTQKTLPFGTPDEVRAEVAERVRTFAPGGGFVFSAVHNIQRNSPPENLVAMLEAAREVGSQMSS